MTDGGDSAAPSSAPPPSPAPSYWPSSGAQPQPDSQFDQDVHAIEAEIRVHDVPLDRQLRAGFAPATRRDAWIWLLFAAIGFLAGQIMASIIVLVVAAINGTHNVDQLANLSVPPEWYVVSTLLGLWAGFFGGPLLASGVKGSAKDGVTATRRFIRDMGLRFRWIDLVGIPIGVAGQYLVAVMYVPFEHHIHNFNQKFSAPGEKLTGGSHGAGFAVIAIFTIVGAPFFEELFFRGLILRAMVRLFGDRLVGDRARWVGPALAIVVTGVLFGLAHAESLQLLGLATFGVILSFVSYRTGRLGMDMIAHASFNLVAIVAVLATGSGIIF